MGKKLIKKTIPYTSLTSQWTEENQVLSP